MSSKLVVIFVLLTFAYVTFGAISRSLPSTHSDHPKKCWYNETQTAYDPGTDFTIYECTRVSCENDYSFIYATCGAVGAAPPCYVVEGNLTLPYPDCCPQVKCS